MGYERRSLGADPMVGPPAPSTAMTWITKADELARTAEAAKRTAASISALAAKKKKQRPPASSGSTVSYAPAPSEGLFGIPWMYVGLGGIVLLGGAFFILRR